MLKQLHYLCKFFSYLDLPMNLFRLNAIPLKQSNIFYLIIVMEINGFRPGANLNYQFPKTIFSSVNSPSNNIILQTNSSQDWLRGNQIKLPSTVFRGIYSPNQFGTV